MATFPSKTFTGTPTESVVTVGATSTAVLSANRDRRFLLLINDSDETIYVSVDGGAAAQNTGIRLNASGGNIMFDGSGYVPQDTVKAICTSGSKKLLVVEGNK